MFEVNQKVWCAMYGPGVVEELLTEDTKFPVKVQFADDVLGYYTLEGKYPLSAAHTLFPYPVEVVKKVLKPSINWDHVASNFNYLAEDSSGEVFLYENEPTVAMDFWSNQGGEMPGVFMFASYVPGDCDWKDSLVKRPAVQS